jgi:hypothetical protein
MNPCRSGCSTQQAVTAIAVLVTACASQVVPARFAATTEAHEGERHAPGVAVDPAPQLPEARPEADSSGGVVVLRAPADPEVARDVVRAFFRAVLDESREALDRVLDAGAFVRSSYNRELATTAWSNRFDALDYLALAGQRLFREADLETFRGDELDLLPPARRPPVYAQPNEMVARVRLSAPRSSRTRLFGDEILFLLTPTGKGYRIRELVEEFQLP